MSLFHAGKPRPSVEYYPNNIGNLALGSARTYSFLVYGREDHSVQLQILNSLHKRGARIVSQNGYVDQKNREFTLCVSADLSDVSVTPDDLIIEIRRIKSVKNAIGVCLKNRMFDGFLFPLTMMLTSRVVAIDCNLMFLLQDRLNNEDSNLALRDVGQSYALDIARQVREKLGATFSDAVIQDNVKDFLKAAGWGSITWESERALERVTIVDPPIYSGRATGNYFIQGIASGVIQAFKKKKFSVAEEVYNQETRSLTLMLAEPHAEPKKLEFQSVEIKALEEVEKVIRSVEIDDIDTEEPTSPKIEAKPVIVVKQSVKGKSETRPLGGGQLEDHENALWIAEKTDELAVMNAISALIRDDLEKETVAKPPPITTPVHEELPLPETKEVKEELTAPPAKQVAERIEPVSPLPERKPVRIAEIKGIREKEDDFEDEEEEVWFERAVQEE